MRWVSEARERLRTLLSGAKANAETTEEMRFHIDMEADRLVREEGVDPAAAQRRAAILFGGVDRHALAVRDARGFGWLSGLSLDVKLGLRMLVKYPGLTLAGGLTLAVAFALAAAWFEFLNDMASPKLPFEEADRIVMVQSWDHAAAQPERRALHDFEIWRNQATAITQLSAYSNAELSVTIDDGRFALLRASRITSTAFGALGVVPLHGRAFEAADEAEGASLPVIIGYEVWEDYFGGDPSVVGRTVVVADEPGTIVGVMPERFGFPTNEQMWVPLRARASMLEPRTGPPVSVFGRLRRGATVAEAQAELATIGDRIAAAYPATHEQLRPRVQTFGDVTGMSGAIRVINLPFILFLLVVCANVATLVYARTAKRGGEVAVRSALGASRRRLMLQLIAEAFVLTSLAALIGLAVAQWGMRRTMALFWEVQQMAPPFFFDESLSPVTILYAAVLSVAAAAVIGGIPAFKATGRGLRSQLAQPGSAGGMRFGAIATTAIVLQVALSVAFLPVAVQVGRDLLPGRRMDASFPAAAYLSGRVSLQADDAVARATQSAGDPSQPGSATIFRELKQRLLDRPDVLVAAFVDQLPGFNHPVTRIELESEGATERRVRVVAVDPDFFDAVNARISAGRSFHPGEFEADARAFIVDAAWAERELGGRNPLGERVRQAREGEGASWGEIVGVVEGMAGAIGPGAEVALYQPLREGNYNSQQFYLRTTTEPGSLVREVHAAAASVDRRFVAHDVKPLDEVWRPVLRSDVFFLVGLNLVAFIIVLFALVGIYALLSFTVAQRAREIAIRAALGAGTRRILMSIFSRAMLQIGAGVLIGAAIVSAAIVRTPATAGLVAGVAALMIVFGIAGCVLPAMRALRIHPAEAMRAE